MTFESVQDSNVPSELLNLGYFFVEDNKIFRLLEMTEDQKEKFLLDGKIPESASLVCSNEEKKDKNKKKGVHEKIIIENDLIEYSYYDDSSATNFYETFIWKKDVGMVLYRRGYSAELNSITLWLGEHISDPHEFSIRGRNHHGEADESQMSTKLATNLYYIDDFGQVYDGDYYFLNADADNNFTIYKNHKDKFLY